MAVKPIKVKITGDDKLSPVLKRVKADITSFGKAARAIRAPIGFLGMGSALAGVSSAFTLGLAQVPGQLLSLETSLRKIKNAGTDLSEQDLPALKNSILEVSVATNQSSEAVAMGVNKLVDLGFATKDAVMLMETVGKVATSTGGDINSLTESVASMSKTLNIPLKDIMNAFDIMARSEDFGSANLEEMTERMPAVVASLKGFGVQSKIGVASFSTLTQLVREAVPSTSEAVGNVEGLIQRLTSRRFLNNLNKIPGFTKNIFEEMNQATKEGGDPIERALTVINDATSKLDPSKRTAIFGILFGDQKTANALLNNLDKYKKIRDEIFATDPVVQNEYEEAMKDINKQWFKTRLLIAKEVSPRFTQFLRTVNTFLMEINGNQEKQRRLINRIKMAIFAGGTLMGLSLVLGTVSKILVGFRDIGSAIRVAIALAKGLQVAQGGVPIPGGGLPVPGGVPGKGVGLGKLAGGLMPTPLGLLAGAAVGAVVLGQKLSEQATPESSRANAAGAFAGMGMTPGNVLVHVKFENVPPGTRVRADTRGDVDSEVEVGKAHALP